MIEFRSRFGFHTAPFTREIPIEHRFSLDFLDDALAALLRAVEQRMSAALVAPAGAGKTLLLRALASKLPEARYRVHYVKVTDLSKRDMCREIAVACGAVPAGSYPMLVRRLQERFLTVSAQDGIRPVLIPDEAADAAARPPASRDARGRRPPSRAPRGLAPPHARGVTPLPRPPVHHCRRTHHPL
jgi:type II secretory pathway predicted ATPase ExeA